MSSAMASWRDTRRSRQPWISPIAYTRPPGGIGAGAAVSSIMGTHVGIGHVYSRWDVRANRLLADGCKRLIRTRMNTIEVENLSKRYGAVLAVDDIGFVAPAGATVGLLGGNGAGKTTTIAMLLGLLVPTSGRITVLGHDMARDRFAALARMNFSSPYVALPARLSVAENLRVYGHLYGVRKTGRRIAELADQLDLHSLLDRPAGELSAGQKTRVALAKSLINRPELLLLDEPTASLDPDAGDLVRSWLERYRTESGCTILLASHNMDEVARLCGTVLM